MTAAHTRPDQPGYVTYAHMDTLLTLQQRLTDEPAEMAFIVLSQVKELLFHLLATDTELAADQLGSDDVDAARRTLRRVLATVQALQASWEPLADMRPDEFARIRTVLDGASGLQSVSYRRWEFAMGRRAAGALDPFDGYPEPRETLAAALRRPSLYDQTLRLLGRRGHDVPAAVLDRDPGTTYDADPAVAAVWVRIYRGSPVGDALLGLAEDLMSLAYEVGRWRYAHLLTVERIIGPKTGTGGTDGASWLSTIAEHRFFPELWQARYEL